MKFNRIVSLILISIAFSLLPALGFAAEDTPTIDTGITAWMLVSTALVLLMVPGLAIFYGGLVRSKNILGTMMHSFGAMAVIGLLWAVVGYCMSFGSNILGGWCGWDSRYLFLMGINDSLTADVIPEYVFAMFQGKFAIITPALIAGSFAERVRFRGYLIFIALWSIFVYSPLCHWVWADGGFLLNMGAIDFAGGTVVHISAGISGLVMALYLGARRGFPKTTMNPSSLVLTMLGAGLLWVGWFGFNAGSSVNSGMDTARALAVTQIAAAAGATAWIIIEGFHYQKASSLGLASGILAGLVVITPAAGVVHPLGAMILGALASLACYFAIQMKEKFKYDDSLDAFGIHGVAGILGAICLVFFMIPRASDKGIGGQLVVQVTAVIIAIIYTAIVTLVLTVIVDKTFGLRLSEEAETTGMDQNLHGEHGFSVQSTIM